MFDSQISKIRRHISSFNVDTIEANNSFQAQHLVNQSCFYSCLVGDALYGLVLSWRKITSLTDKSCPLRRHTNHISFKVFFIYCPILVQKFCVQQAMPVDNSWHYFASWELRLGFYLSGLFLFYPLLTCLGRILYPGFTNGHNVIQKWLSILLRFPLETGTSA